jgi:hypothetical protein
LRVFAVMVLPIMVAGCGVPTAISVASYFADGVSAGASGKSVNDHLISQVVNMDCGLTRVFDGEWICRERGIDPYDDTVYPADEEFHKGPPRPWGTNREPNLQYHRDADYRAREWARGTDLAVVDVGDDPSGEIVSARFSEEGSYDGPAEIGDLSEAHERDDIIQAKDDHVESTQTVEIQIARYDAPAAASTGSSPDIATGQVAPVLVADLDVLEPQKSDGSVAAEGPETVLVASSSANAIDSRLYGDADDSDWSSDVAEAPLAVAAASPVSKPVQAIGIPSVASAPPPIAPAPRPTADIRLIASRSTMIDRTPAAGAHADGRYLVVGSYAERRNAEAVTRTRRDVDLAVVETVIAGRTFYRVVAGPYGNDALERARLDLAAAGFDDNWTIARCEPTPENGYGCISEMQAAALDFDREEKPLQVAGLQQ